MSSKQVKTTKPAVVAPTVVVEPVVKVELAPVVEKASKKTASKKTDAVVVPIVVAPVVVVEEVVVALVAESTETSIAVQTTDFFAKLQQLGAVISGLKSEYRALEKRWTKELKASAKNSNKKRKRAANRAPSGFVKPTKISDELATFLDKPTGSEMARTEVTRDINAYIRTNSLQDKANGRLILADEKLKKLLNYDEKTVADPSQHLSYFNLQRYLSGHFEKSVA